ncbi:MAG TPA: cytochrome-c peroxidase, partial [Vicinamibacteria bacterium]
MKRLARFLKVALLAVASVLVVAVVAAGFWPVAADIPALPMVSHTPGDGGLRRPFPAPLVRPDNPVTPERIALGRLLFFDPILSGANDQSCATCHHPDLGFADGRGQSMGKGGRGLGPERASGTVIKRAAPTVWNAAFNHRQFWDGRAADLEDQARFPITSDKEMDQKPDELVRELRGIPEYVRLFDGAFGGQDGAGVAFDNVTRAIAAFERTLVSDRSRFDRYRAGDAGALGPAER